jgi:hypothetical protein
MPAPVNDRCGRPRHACPYNLDYNWRVLPRGTKIKMKIDNLTTVFLIISVLIPGFIYGGVVSNLVPTRAGGEKEVLILRYLTATAFNYAICSPLIYLLVFNQIFKDDAVVHGILWFLVIFVIPVILGFLRGWIVQHDGLRWFHKLIRLRSINPIPTGWDWIFSTTDPCYLLITLTDGTEIAGYFGPSSMASSDPEHKDIFIEKVYKAPRRGHGVWQPVDGSLGMYVEGTQIAYIEFRG